MSDADAARRRDRSSPRVVVVGGGISGLTTALRIAESTAPTTSTSSTTSATAHVIDVEVREASGRIGGKLKTTPFAGRPAVDEGADAFLARVPHATALARHLGLELTSPEPVNAAVWVDGLHDIPEGLLLGVPSDLRRLAGSGLLSWRGKLRAAAEPLLPRRGDPADSIGALVRSRFGDEVHERLVDALVGSIYGADTDRFSLAMVPQLAAIAGERSILLAARRARAKAPASTGPLFYAPVRGMAELAESVAAAAATIGVTVTTSAPVSAIERDAGGWRVDGERADAVVLASPAAVTAPLVRRSAPELAEGLAAMEHAGVAIVTMAVPDWPDRLRGRSGYLVPKPAQRTVTAASFGAQKWAHWAGDGEVLRVSLGRDGLRVDDLDDDQLVTRAVAETGEQIGLDLQPTAVRVSRWPAAFPQYRPGHRDWLDAIDRQTPAGLFLTGASYRGIGVPACVADAEASAAAVVEYVTSRR